MSVYLPPRKGGWYDFWTHRWHAGAEDVPTPAPYDQIPLYIPAGSIVPIGPSVQYTAERPFDPVTLNVYAGADGHFDLYEDDGLTYRYEKGAFTTIPVSWDDRSGVLKIGARAGSFPGMPYRRTFKVVVHRRSGERLTASVEYGGRAKSVRPVER
jgi:alpha-D-xyloside xylohydrolase